MPYVSMIFSAWVPLPAPGNPIKMRFIYSPPNFKDRLMKLAICENGAEVKPQHSILTY